MKQSDLLTIIVITIFGFFISIYGVNAILGNPDNAKYQLKQPMPISNELAEPDREVFNPGAVNPTIEVFIGACVDSNQNGILEPTEKLECASPENRNKRGKEERSLPQPQPEPQPQPAPVPAPQPQPVPTPNLQQELPIPMEPDQQMQNSDQNQSNQVPPQPNQGGN